MDEHSRSQSPVLDWHKSSTNDLQALRLRENDPQIGTGQPPCALLLAVEDTFLGANQFGEELWLRFWRMGSLDVKWPIRIGFWNEMMLGFCHDGVGCLLRQMASPPEGHDYLAEITTAANERLRWWAAKQIASGYPER